MKALRIIVGTPSPIERSRLTKIVSAHPGMQVIAQAADLSETYTLAESLEPDVVLLSHDYCAVPEFDCMKSLFYALNACWLVIGGPGTAAGATRPSDPAFPAIARDFTADAILQQIHAVRALRGSQSRRPPALVQRPVPKLRPDRIVLIGASTGGVDALLQVLATFPAACPPTAIVQHTGKGFSDSLIRLLDRRCAAEVVAVSDGVAMQVGRVCVAGGTDGHLRLSGGNAPQCRIVPGDPVSGHVPSVDELFRSAVPMANQVVAVLLTGMGRDGAEGLLALRRAGARTLGQDEASAVVYGMPRAALEIGAVEQQLPLDRIGPEILRLCARDTEARTTVK